MKKQSILKGNIEINSLEKNDLKHLRELKAQRDLFEALLQAVPEGIIVLDLNDNIIFVNQLVKKYLQLKNPFSQIELKTSFLWDIFNNTKKLDFLSYHREIELLDPSLKYYSVSCFPFETINNEFLRIYFIKDITNEKTRNQSTLVNPNFSDNLTFGAGIAHELGNPIAALSLHAQLIDRLFKNKSLNKEHKNQIKNSIQVLRNELKRLDNTIHEFLDAVRPTNPQFKLSLMSETINEVINTLLEKAKEVSVNICFTALENEDKFLYDPERMKQALTNVILNAIEVSNPFSHIDIFHKLSRDFCEIFVIDYGKGIEAGEIEKIFDPYYTTKESGNGLGLLITYRIIRDHGGSITVKSKPFKGTTFVMSIPMRIKAIKQLPKNN